MYVFIQLFNVSVHRLIVLSKLINVPLLLSVHIMLSLKNCLNVCLFLGDDLLQTCDFTV